MTTKYVNKFSFKEIFLKNKKRQKIFELSEETLQLIIALA